MKIVKILSFLFILFLPFYIFSFKLCNKVDAKIKFDFLGIGILDKDGNSVENIELEHRQESGNLMLNPKDIKKNNFEIMFSTDDWIFKKLNGEFGIVLNNSNYTSNGNNYTKDSLNSENTILCAFFDGQIIKIVDLDVEREKKSRDEEYQVIAPGGPGWKK